MLPLEAEAVEREVLALCTERSEAMARFLDAQARLNGALAVVRAPQATPGGGPVPAAADDRVERLRSEVATLKSRIARLEGDPERPETEALRKDLSDQLATAEADLALAEETAGRVGAGQADVPPPDAAGIPVLATGPETGREEPAPLPPPGVAAPETEVAVEQPAEAWPAEDAAPVPVTGPRGRRTEWRLIHAVRRDDGQWHVRLQGTRELPVRIPGATPDAPERIHWQPVLDPPVTLSEGDVLADGLALLKVLPDGVMLDDPASPDGEPVLVPFVTGESIAAGHAEWDFETIMEAAREVTLPEGLSVLAVSREGVLLGDPAAPGAEPALVPFAVQENGEGGS